MANKTFRSITDVEIVEQMTENDTILIEQNGMIKRTKGVVGGGEKHTILIESGAEGEILSADISYDELLTLIKAGDVPDMQLIIKDLETGDFIAKEIVGSVFQANETTIFIETWSVGIQYTSDGMLQLMQQ